MKRVTLTVAVALTLLAAPTLAQPEIDIPELDTPSVEISLPDLEATVRASLYAADDALIISAYVLATTSVPPIYEMDTSHRLNAAAAVQMKDWEFLRHIADHTWDAADDRAATAAALAAYVPPMTAELERILREAHRRDDPYTMETLEMLTEAPVHVSWGVPLDPDIEDIEELFSPAEDGLELALRNCWADFNHATNRCNDAYKRCKKSCKEASDRRNCRRNCRNASISCYSLARQQLRRCRDGSR